MDGKTRETRVVTARQSGKIDYDLIAGWSRGAGCKIEAELGNQRGVWPRLALIGMTCAMLVAAGIPGRVVALELSEGVLLLFSAPLFIPAVTRAPFPRRTTAWLQTPTPDAGM